MLKKIKLKRNSLLLKILLQKLKLQIVVVNFMLLPRILVIHHHLNNQET